VARHVHLAVERTAAATPGTLDGAVQLRVRGVTVLDWRLVRLDAAALALARAATAGHRAGGAEPLFGIADLSIAHDGKEVTLSDFRGCDVPREASFAVPWAAFAGAVLRLGNEAVRRGGTPVPGVAADEAARRAAARAELRALLKPIRVRHRSLVRRPRSERA
jgi:hypothetical protein